MEWKNLSQDHHYMGNKYLLNVDENMELNNAYIQENSQDEKKFIDNDLIEQDENDKINYYFLQNNMDNSNNEYQFYNQKFELVKTYMNYPNKNNNLEIPFLNKDNEKKINRLSTDLNNKINIDKNIKNLFKIKSYSSGDDNNNQNIKNKEMIRKENNDIIKNYQNMILNGKMELKKEKAKKLLENKTQREKVQEESKENKLKKHSISNKCQENILEYISNNNNICNYYNSNINNSLNLNLMSKMSKKEKKMLRNRISAQRSRDRKKKQLIDLKTITHNLLIENEKLRKEIKQRDDKINKLLKLLCPKCQKTIKNNNLDIKVTGSFDSSHNMIDDESLLSPSNIVAGKKKLALLMSGLFTVFCIFGVFMTPDDKNTFNHLKVKNNLENKNNEQKRVQEPFIIEKDYTKRHKKKIEIYQTIQRNNLKNINVIVQASLLHNNSFQIISNINTPANNINTSTNNIKNNINDDNVKETIHDMNDISNNNLYVEANIYK